MLQAQQNFKKQDQIGEMLEELSATEKKIILEKLMVTQTNKWKE